jgi:hypothetical protein
MKTFLLIFVFFLVGLALVLGYRYWNQPHTIFRNTTPALTTKFSLEKAPSESLQGSIATVSGSVIWLSRTAAKPVKLTSLRSIQQGEELSTGSNGQAVIKIQNDTSLLLLQNTHVSIIQLLPENFVFVQDKGSVRYENTIQVPVSVKSFGLITLITKGIVTVTVDPKNQKVTVAVVKGIIKEAYEDAQNTSNVLTVNAGQTFVYDETNKIGSIE